jgi:hypothetical protein
VSNNFFAARAEDVAECGTVGLDAGAFVLGVTERRQPLTKLFNG